MIVHTMKMNKFWEYSTGNNAFESVETPSTRGYILNQDDALAQDNHHLESNEKNNKDGFISWFQHSVGQLVNNETFQHLIVVLISINAIMMGVATFDFVTENEPVHEFFDTIDGLFLIIFTVELGLQFIHHGLDLFKDNWLVFDFFVILLSWSIDGMQIVRAFRVIRAIRLVVR